MPAGQGLINLNLETREAMKSAGRFHGLARVLSKRGVCSRAEAVRWILDGRVSIDGMVVRDPERRTHDEHRGLAVDGRLVGAAAAPVYLMLNKPRGLVTSSADELGRETVYRCLEGGGLPRVLAVGRLDKASEGLLLFTNDTKWAERVSAPQSHVPKRYHVQVKPVPTPRQLEAMVAGVGDGKDGTLQIMKVTQLRTGGVTAWIEVVLDEGKNRQIRRIFEALGLETLRLVRVAVGGLELGDLAKGSWRALTPREAVALAETVNPARGKESFA